MIPLNSDGRTVLVPSTFVRSLPWRELVKWCVRTARYGLVTSELIEWLRGAVGDRKAIEIGAGQGDLGYHLGIHMTDSAIQTTPEMQLLYAQLGQQTTTPPRDVERLDAAAAVRKHRPAVVIGSWVTQKYCAGDENHRTGSSVYGVDEMEIIREVETYVHIGSLSAGHEAKRALALPHRVHEFPWLWSRTRRPADNRIWVWENRK